MAKTKITDFKILIFYYCPVLKKELSKEIGSINFTSLESDCECCGSHGGKGINFLCKCKKEHEIEILDCIEI